MGDYRGAFGENEQEHPASFRADAAGAKARRGGEEKISHRDRARAVSCAALQKGEMKAPKRRRKKRSPSMRFKLDGEWWTVRVQRPPSKELCEGMAHYRRRTVYLHPRALKQNMAGIVAHEIAHVTMPCVAETNVRDHERVVSVVLAWAAGLMDGKVSIGKHKAA